MANIEHLARLREGVEAWNKSRGISLLNKVDLSGADLHDQRLSGADLGYADLTRANLSGTTLSFTKMTRSNLSGADLSHANLEGAYLVGANLSEATLTGVNFIAANLREADLTAAKCLNADFSYTTLTRAKLTNADITGARIYGISAWDIELLGTVQRHLIITSHLEPSITVDDLEVAQFIYLLLNNNKVRKVIDTITSKLVLILGRFSPERKAVLDALREELRRRDYLPVVFDFEKPSTRDLTETASTLAHMAKFIIADLTDAKSIPQELAAVVPFLPSVPVQPILLASEKEWAMYEHFPRYPWVLDIARYDTAAELIANLGERVIGPAEQKLSAQAIIRSR